MDINSALKAFVRTVERGSITGAARDLAISQPAVTKHLLNLERHVKARLLERSPKNVRPTDQGLALYESCRYALASIDAALEGVRLNAGEIDGPIRVHSPACIGEKHLYGMLIEFQDAHPGVNVELVLDNRSVDLIYENFDIAIRYGKIEGQNIIARRIGWIQRILVASPEFLNRVGEIGSIEALSELDMVATTSTISSRNTIFLSCDGDPAVELPIRPVLKTNNAQVLVKSLLSGRGVGPVQVNLILDELREGKLQRVLPHYDVRPTEIALTYPSTKFMRPVVRAFTDFVVPRLRTVEGIALDGQAATKTAGKRDLNLHVIALDVKPAGGNTSSPEAA